MTITESNLDPKGVYSQEYLRGWCKENHLPENYFDLPVQKRREEFKKAQKRLAIEVDNH